MDNGAELDIRDWISGYLTPTYRLDSSEKEKRAISTTTTRPGALVESSSAKGSNKALSYEHVTVMKVRDITDPKCSTIVVKVDLVHIKNSEGKGRRMLRAPPNRGSPDAEPGVAQQEVRRMRNQELPNKGSSNGVAPPDAEQGVKGFTP
ncbi:MAG: hypothetical protein M1813_000098 [Trichoglossum hirsutum]|nr:MAG: hypothetical protein M1813_000098 [Trichoglossum hirsutum]